MKLFVGPMSKNVIDAAIEFDQENPGSDLLGFIPSRRQIETFQQGGGYVCGWSTEDFVQYVRSKGSNLIIKRDHGGPSQGAIEDDGIISLMSDVEAGIKHMHIDPWKKFRDLDDAATATAHLLDLCYDCNHQCLFEIGTEEGIRRYEAPELNEFILSVKRLVRPEVFANVIYAVVQSGTSVVGLSNVGMFDQERSRSMSAVCHAHGLLAKEHNSDYLDIQELHLREQCGVDAFNIAPELGVIETQTLISMLDQAGLYNELNAFLTRCVMSGKWERWVHWDEGFQEECVKYLSQLCGHYNFETEGYRVARAKLIEKGFDYDRHVRSVVKKRIEEIVKG